MPTRATRSRDAAAAMGALTDAPTAELTNGDSLDVRDRLLQVSGEFFGRDGYNRTSVRDICRAARANVASIRYYFGSKLGLYREVLLGEAQLMIQQYPMPVLGEGETPEQGLRTWAAHLLNLKLRECPEDSLMCRLMSHEMNDPSPALDEMVALLMEPLHLEVERIIEMMLGDKASPAMCRHLSLNFTGLCFQYSCRRHVMERMDFKLPSTQQELDDLTDFVTTFFIGGAKAIAGRA